MRKNFLLFFTLAFSFIFTLMVGTVVSFDGKKLRINQQLINSILPPIKISPSKTVNQGGIESLAQCLSNHHFVMYGITGCSACNTQREYFGGSFALIRYVDCAKEQELCFSKNVHSYPTWEDQKGNKYKGAMSLEVIAQLSGCPFSK